MLRFVINLDRVPDRWCQMNSRFKELEIPVERISAVDGSLFTDGIPSCYTGATVRYPRLMSAGEVACFLSHRKCWERLLDSSEDWALCMEDDLVISERARQFMQSADWIPSQVKILQLSTLRYNCTGRNRKQKIKIDDKTDLVMPLLPSPVGTQAYLISREAAQWAVEHSEKFNCPVDEFLFSLWFEMANRFPTWRISPVCVVEKQIESNITGRKTMRKLPFFVRHGFKHLWLEFQVYLKRRNGVESFIRFE